MKWLRIRHNENVILSSMEDGVILVHTNIINPQGNMFISCSGYDSLTKEHLSWYRSSIVPGDTIDIETADIETNSFEIERIENYQTLIDEYKYIEAQLMKAGLI